MSDNMTAGMLVCAHDKTKPAEEYCPQCVRNYCVMCSKVMHKKADIRDHVRISFADIKCSHDEEEKAEVYCNDCQKHFCAECDEVIHLDPEIKSHTRYGFVSLPQSPVVAISASASPSLSSSSSSLSPPPLSLPSSPSIPISPPTPVSLSQSLTNDGIIPDVDVFIGKYKIDNRSIWGGTNEIRTGVDTTTHEGVALKIFTEKKSFENEVEMLKKVRSEHVVRMIDVIKDSELASHSLYNKAAGIIVIEKLHESLRDRMKRKLDFMAIRNVVGQIGSSLEFLHSEHRVVHGDLKPENIMRKDDIWKLIDLDSAKTIGEPIASHTANYCPPEVAAAHLARSALPASPTMDVWSFGIIFFELLTGGIFESFHGKNDEQKLALLAKDFAVPYNLISDVQARHLLQKILVAKPQGRATMPEVMRHAYFRGGLDTTQKATNIASVSEQLISIKKDTSKILDQIVALRTQLLESTEYVIPRLFIVIPSLLGKTSWANPNHWGMNTFKLHLMCENDEVHLTDHPGYPIVDPKPFVRKAAPIVSALCRILNAASSVAKPVTGGVGVPDAIVQKLDTIGIRPTEYLEFLSKTIDDVTGTKNGAVPASNFQHVRGQALRELKAFLDTNDPGNIYGRLEKVVLPDGHVRWLCPHHAHQYTTGIERLTRPQAVMAIPPIIPPPATAISKDEPLKIVTLGSGGCHKSPLTVQYVQGVFVAKYNPTIEDSYRCTREVDGRLFNLEILDTAGTEQFTAMRDLYMKNGNGFILCFNIKSTSNFNDLWDLREQILRVKDADSVPVVIAGISLKSHHLDKRAVTHAEAEEMARKMGGKYVEVVIREKINVDLVFHTLVQEIQAAKPVAKSPKSKPAGVVKKLFGSKSSNSQNSFIVDKPLWRTAIHQAVTDANLEKLTSLLSSDNSHINAQDANFRTALHLACRKPTENLAIIKVLLEAGASIVAQDSMNKNSFHMIAEKGDTKLWGQLCLHAANTMSDFSCVFTQDYKKHTPLHYLQGRHDIKPSEFIESLVNAMSMVHDPIVLDFGGLQLQALPSSVYSLSSAKALILQDNNIKSISPDISRLSNITLLDISENKMPDSAVPPNINMMPYLTTIIAHHNSFTSVPQGLIECAKNVKKVDFGFNKIEKLPDLTNWARIQVLNVESNQIKGISPSFSRLATLTEVKASNNQLASFPSTSSLLSLVSLDLSNNAINAAFPLSPSLVSVQLPKNQIPSLAIPAKNKLERLVMDHNKLATVPDNLGAANKLTHLSLSFNQIKQIPSSIWNLQSLKTLDLSHNGLTVICSEVFNLPSLSELHLHNNGIKELPETINLSNLTLLNISSNPIASIPSSLGRSTKLVTLNITGTQIKALPKTMATLKLHFLLVDKALAPLGVVIPTAEQILAHLTK